jgi:cellulose synthase/poly-beta-1,6-N-acetylglucosamine synthase-like glycosyltransferase
MNSILHLASMMLVLLSMGLAIPVVVFIAQIALSDGAAAPDPHAGDAPPARPQGRLAVLIPAHDEERLIATTIHSVSSQLAPGDRLLVVADNCSDRTADIARQHGAEVVERFSDLRGKGYALAFGVDHLRLDPPDMVVVVDADCQLSAGGLDRLAATLARTGRPVQALYLMRSAAGACLGRRLAEFAWRVRNQLRPAGWQRLGLPCQLMGTGMAFTWNMLLEAPLANGSIVEDLKLGIDLACAGTSPVFCPEVLVTSQFPDSAAGAASQRTRWEHGHLEMILREVPAMVGTALVRGDLRLLGLALDLVVPPLALLASLLALVWVLALATWLAGADSDVLAFVSALFVVFVSAVFAAWLQRGRELVRFAELLSIPWYMAAKMPLYLRFLVGRQKTWVRTDRERRDERVETRGKMSRLPRAARRARRSAERHSEL